MLETLAWKDIFGAEKPNILDFGQIIFAKPQKTFFFYFNRFDQKCPSCSHPYKFPAQAISPALSRFYCDVKPGENTFHIFKYFHCFKCFHFFFITYWIKLHFNVVVDNGTDDDSPDYDDGDDDGGDDDGGGDDGGGDLAPELVIPPITLSSTGYQRKCQTLFIICLIINADGIMMTRSKNLPSG